MDKGFLEIACLKTDESEKWTCVTESILKQGMLRVCAQPERSVEARHVHRSAQRRSGDFTSYRPTIPDLAGVNIFGSDRHLSKSEFSGSSKGVSVSQSRNGV